MRLHRIALGPVRAASRTGREVLADETERAIEATLGGPLPEMIGRALVEERVAERIVAEMLDAAARRDGRPDAAVERVLRSPALERWVGGEDSARLAEAVAGRVVCSPEFRRAVAEMLASPEIRRALTQSAAGFGEETAGAARGKARGADDRLERRVHALLRRPQPAHAGFAGVATRGLALVVDGALAQAGFLLVGASLGLVLGLAGELHAGLPAGLLAGGGWLLVVAAYFGGFWSATGQTPGSRLLGLRVVTSTGEPPSLGRALARVAGLLLAILPLGAGFLPALVDRRRRALPDFLAGTTVVYDVAR